MQDGLKVPDLIFDGNKLVFLTKLNHPLILSQRVHFLSISSTMIHVVAVSHALSSLLASSLGKSMKYLENVATR